MKIEISMMLGLGLVLAACGEGEAAHDHSEHAEHAAHAEHAEHADHSEHAEHAAHADHAAHGSQLMPAAAPTLDGHSLLHLDEDLSLVDRAGAPFALRTLAGKPTLITFFYSGCDTMCPLIVADVHQIVRALPEAMRSEVEVVLVTIDPARDTPERLRTIAEEREMPASWRLVGGDEGSIRALASTLGMTYRRLPDGNFAHAALYTVLDREGRVVHQLEGTGRPTDATTGVLREQIERDPS